jgi:hypothetical protein
VIFIHAKLYVGLKGAALFAQPDQAQDANYDGYHGDDDASDLPASQAIGSGVVVLTLCKDGFVERCT